MKHVRNKEAITSVLVKQENGGPILTKADLFCEVPSRFYERELGSIGETYSTIGYFPLIRDTGEYSVMSACSLFDLTPTSVQNINIDGSEYKRLFFEKGSTVIRSSRVVQTATLVFYVLDEFILKGNVPWYFSYDDLGKIFDSVKRYAGSTVGQSQETVEFIASMITRSKEQKTKYVREVASSFRDVEIDKLYYIALTNVLFAANDTLNKIVGNYFSDGVTSALVTNTKKSGKIERILRA